MEQHAFPTAKIAALLMFLACPVFVALAQEAPPTANVLSRVLMVESQYGRGTIFSIDVDDREYWITAKHILTGAKHPPYGSVASKTASLRILNPDAQGEQWLTVNFSVVDPGNDIDIVALVPPEPLLNNPLPSVATDSVGVLLGGDCEFLGFPYGGGWRAPFANGGSFWMPPYVKHCTVSAMGTGEPKIWVLDGINKAGFSGGPVIFRTGIEQKIFGVVSGYLVEPTDVIPSVAGKKRSTAVKKKPVARSKETVNLNSGFIVAFDIGYAIEAINKNPIGPLRKVK
jgi:hypothetical protein